jgi:uncharacterized membrane protein
MGVLVHVAMLLLMLALPAGFVWITFQTIALTVITTYPLATVLIGKILTDQKTKKTLDNGADTQRGKIQVAGRKQPGFHYSLRQLVKRDICYPAFLASGDLQAESIIGNSFVGWILLFQTKVLWVTK